MPSFYSLSSSARDLYIEGVVNKPSDRRIIDIVKSTIAPNVRTPKSILQEYVSIHPAIYGYSVRRGTSGRDERRTKNRYEKLYWELPGGGPTGNPGVCDRIHGSEACTDSVKGRPIAFIPNRWYCDRPTCPECFEHWTVTTAKDAMKKIIAGKQLFSFYGSRYRLCHVVISAPPEHSRFIGRRKGYDLIMEDFYRSADAFDMHGYMIFHPWRGKKDNDSDVTLKVFDEDLTDSDYWTFGPHAHLVAFCDPDRIIGSSEEFYKSTGFVIKVISSDLSEEYAENVMSYALSHCGVGHWEGHKDLKTLHPFGYLATSKKGGLYKLADIKEDVPKTCSECGGFLYSTRELDLRLPEEDLIHSTVPLHHEIFVRRSDKEDHKFMIAGLSDGDVMEYARHRPYDVALVMDRRDTEVQALCDVDKAVSDDLKRPVYWRRPFIRGQSLISPFEINGPPALGGCI